MGDATMASQVDLMEQVWSSIDELCSSLGADDWDRVTDCPGWSVKDQLSHLAGNEARLLGRAGPTGEPPPLDYIRNPLGASNELQVDQRRPLPPEDVLEEWRELTQERLRKMRAWTAEEWDESAWAPAGEPRRRDVMPLRIFDAWVHEQDMRRAVGRPGHVSGAVARHAFDIFVAGMPYVVAKKAQAPEGSIVVFDVAGGPARTFAVTVTGGWGSLSDPPQEPTVRLSMDFETFTCLAAGRWTGERARDEERVEVAGDETLARAILDTMDVVP